MACTACKCENTLMNTGHKCTPIIDVTAMLIAVPTYDSQGNKNAIPLSATLNQSYFNLLINHADASKRWRPLPKMKNISDVRAEATFFTYDDQSVEFIQEGARKFSALITNESGTGATSAQMKKIISSMRCADGVSFYIVTKSNQLVGQISEDGASLEPIEIDEQSMLPMFMKKTSEAPQHIVLQFNWSVSAMDENLAMFDCSELGDANLLSLKGLVDICGDVIEVTNTSLTIKLFASFGTAKNPAVVTGLQSADFVSADDGVASKIYNATTQSNVSIVATEVSDGVYELTYSSQSTSDALIVKPKSNGYDFLCVEQAPIEVVS